MILKADGPAVRILWSIVCNEACVTAAVRTTENKNRLHQHQESQLNETTQNQWQFPNNVTVKFDWFNVNNYNRG